MCGVKVFQLNCIHIVMSIAVLATLFPMATPKWVEGHIKTSKNWAFLARFCFLSYDGQFEYQIEFSRDIGLPNLLLYYDDDSQWPSIYHSNKTCSQREAVLNKAGQNQIIPLSHWYPESEYSGCVLKTTDPDSPKTTTTPKPSTKSKNKTEKKLPKPKMPPDPNVTTQDPRYFDQFLKPTPSMENTTYFSISSTTESDMELLEDVIDGQNSSSIDSESIEGFAEVPLVSIGRDGNKNDSDILANLEDVETMFDSSEKSASIVKRSPLEQHYEKTKMRRFDPSPPRPKGPLPPGSAARLTVSCHNARRFRSVRERWWFVAISNCGESKGLDVKYRFLMTNGPPGDYWHEHFSADEFYVLPILTAFCFAYVLTTIALVMCSVELKSRQLLHTTYKLFLASVALQQVGVFLQSLAYVKYAVNGIGGNNTKTMGQLMCGLSEITYLLLLLLMAKGYTITRARLKVAFTIKLTVFICSYFITYISLFIYQAKEFDPGEVLYLYESPAGYGLIVLRICAWFMFIYAIIFTIRKYPEKGTFYYPFSLCGTMWFYAGPLFILSANNYIDKWVRESVVIAVLLFIAFSGHISFLLLTLPTFANKNFPYHVRTTQIGVMETVGMVAGNSTMDRFSHHIYNPQHSLAAAQAVIIPLTRRTEQLFGGANHYMATAPPLHAMSPLQSPGIPNSNNTTISYISGSMPQLLTTNNIGPKLSISTQHSAESITDDRTKPLTEEQRSDSLENRFVPPKIMNENHVQNGDVKYTNDLEDKIKSESNDSIYYIETNDRRDSIIDECSYKDDPNYIKDINNPFLVNASMRRKGLLEPIVKRDAYNIPPPKWSLAKNKNLKPGDKNKESDVKKADTDYQLQGVIASFPLPQIPKSAGRTRQPQEDINVDIKSNVETPEAEKEEESSAEDSLHLLQGPGDQLELDETVLALYTQKEKQ